MRSGEKTHFSHHHLKILKDNLALVMMFICDAKLGDVTMMGCGMKHSISMAVKVKGWAEEMGAGPGKDKWENFLVENLQRFKEYPNCRIDPGMETEIHLED